MELVTSIQYLGLYLSRVLTRTTNTTSMLRKGLNHTDAEADGVQCCFMDERWRVL